VGDTVHGTSPSRSPPTTEEIRSLVADTIQQTLPMLLKEALKEAVPSRQPNPIEPPNPTDAVVASDECQHLSETPQLNSRLSKYYSEAKEAQLSDEVTTFLTTAFTKRLSKEVWSELMQKYPPIKGMDEVLLPQLWKQAQKNISNKSLGTTKPKRF